MVQEEEAEPISSTRKIKYPTKWWKNVWALIIIAAAAITLLVFLWSFGSEPIADPPSLDQFGREITIENYNELLAEDRASLSGEIEAEIQKSTEFDFNLHNTLINSYINGGEFEKALEEYGYVLEHAESTTLDSGFYQSYAGVAEELGEIEQAIDLYETALALIGDDLDEGADNGVDDYEKQFIQMKIKELGNAPQ